MTGRTVTVPAPASGPLVERRLAQVMSALSEATGGAALCRIDGTGGSAKLLEGRMAALLEVRRALRRDPGADVAAVLTAWRSTRDAHRARGASAAWRDYDEGGVTELEWLVGQVAALGGRCGAGS